MLKQQLNFKLSQKLSPQQIQLMKLIQLPTQAFEQRISQEIEENPALEGGKDGKDEYDDDFSNEEYDSEIDDGNELIESDINIDEYLSDDETPNYKLSANNYSPDDEDKQIPYASGTSFNQYLLQQLNTYRFNEKEKEIARFLVGSVDEGGYIRRDLMDIVDDLAFTQNIFTTEEEIVKIIKIVQNLDPAGVGAKNLQECLLIQLKRKNTSEAILIAIRLIEESFDQFTKKPQFAGCNSDISILFLFKISTQDPSDPKLGQEAPPNARIVKSDLIKMFSSSDLNKRLLSCHPSQSCFFLKVTFCDFS